MSPDCAVLSANHNAITSSRRAVAGCDQIGKRCAPVALGGRFSAVLRTYIGPLLEQKSLADAVTQENEWRTVSRVEYA